MAKRKDTTLPRLLTVVEAARYLGRAVQTLHDWRHKGAGPPWVEIVGGIRYDADALRDWLVKNTRRPER